MFSMDNAEILGVDETSPKIDRLAREMAALVDSVLGSDGAPEGAARAELERTKLAVGAAVISFRSLLASKDLNAAAIAFASATREGDPESARQAAAALAAASQAFLTGTEGSQDGWPEDLRRKLDAQRRQAEVYLASSNDWLAAPGSGAGQVSPEHPTQLAAQRKLIDTRLELAESEQQIEAMRNTVRTGPLRARAVALVALGLALAGRKGLERAERSYARTAASRPRSADLFARARSEREAALRSFIDSEKHRQAARAALEAPVGRPWVAGSVQFLLGWAIVGAALAANYAVFALFDENYFRWYLANGALIAIVFGFVSLAVRLDDYPDLVSSNPLLYLFACLTLSLHLFLAWNQVIAVDPERATGLLLAKLFDLVVSILAWACVTVAFIAWLLVMAPVQYLPYAVLGAPARNALRNPDRPQYDPETDTTLPTATEGSTGHTIGYMEKPVTLTSALTAAVLWVVTAFAW
ncbi:MAG TPA: hypothetical protein VD704_03175 [Gaiellaceae bacterium]|nr:hypothetical protein [Gaiellaceae bacterium]